MFLRTTTANGVKAWQWDPSKWFIAAMSWLGLAKNLKRVPGFKIQRALLDAQFVGRSCQLSTRTGHVQIEHLKLRVAEEYESFLQRRRCLDPTSRSSVFFDAKRVMLLRWERSPLQLKLQEMERDLKIQYSGCACCVLRSPLPWPRSLSDLRRMGKSTICLIDLGAHK